MRRREFLRLTAGALLVPAIARAASPESRNAFSFVVINDLHYRDARCGEWLERVVASVRALRPPPAFCVLAGDLSESGMRDQLGAVREIFAALPMPVRAIIGNHDYSDAGARREFERLHGSQLNYRFTHRGWEFLALDTTQGTSVYRTRIATGTIDWTARALRDIRRDRPVVVLTHFPLGRNWLRPLNAAALLARFERHDLRAVFSGHWHGQTERRERGAILSTGRCCSWWRGNHELSQARGYVVCEAGGPEVSGRFIQVA